MSHDPKPPAPEEVRAPLPGYTSTEPEYVGPFRTRPELAILPPNPDRKIGFTCYQVLGAEVYPIPEGEAISEKLLDDTNILTGEADLKEGMRLLVPTLFGWAEGIISLDEKGALTCRSSSGDTLHMLTFAHDRPPQEDGTPAPPRWVCTGSANLKGLRKLTLYRDAPPEEPAT